MSTFNSEVADTCSRTLNTILREDYGWTDANFVGGMAKLNMHRGQPMGKFWEPKRSFVRRVLGRVLGSFTMESRVPKVSVRQVIKPGIFLRFLLPDEKAMATLKPIAIHDVQNWAVFFLHEATYSFSDESNESDEWRVQPQKQISQAEKASHIFGQWFRFEGYEGDMQDFDFTVKSLKGDVEVRIPTIVFYGAEWIEIAEPHSP